MNPKTLIGAPDIPTLIFAIGGIVVALVIYHMFFARKGIKL